MKATDGEPEEVWYKDETNEFQEQLKAYEHMVRHCHTPGRWYRIYCFVRSIKSWNFIIFALILK